MISIWLIACFLGLYEIFCNELIQVNVRVNYEAYYNAGVNAYLENQWKVCVNSFEKAIEEHFYHQSIVLDCRQNCSGNDNGLINGNNDLPWKIHQFIAKRYICTKNCQSLYLGDHQPISKMISEEFEKKTPYNYLQLCYFKINELEKAASCAFTFLIHNPDHEVMSVNLQYYLSLTTIDHRKVIYLEPQIYQDLFLKGSQLYSDGNYQDSVEVIEKSIEEYLRAEERCRLKCEGPMKESFDDELYISITDYLNQALQCKMQCPQKLSFMYGQKQDDLFASHYHYLQFNYYKLGKLKEACSAVESYLLFHPDDKTMISNKEYYYEVPGVEQKWFSARKEVKMYYERYRQEKDLLSECKKSQSSASVQSLAPPPGKSIIKNSLDQKKLGKERKRFTPEQISEWLKENEISVEMDQGQLNGTKRVSFQHLASEEECQSLVDLAAAGAVNGDGYDGKESPHTEFEMFVGLTITRTTTLAQHGQLDPVSAKLFLSVSEKARKAVEVYFNLESELFFAYTHLVCRTSLPDSPKDRSDFSHPIHADNCILAENGKCRKEKPAYTWRDYSSIIYLNEDFEGGEFVFAANKKKIQASVKPKCGLMVAFSAGKENLHGVKAVKKGKRCALAMWYTLDSAHREKERDFADNVLNGLVSKKRFLNLNVDIESFKRASLKSLSKVKKANNEPHHRHTEL